MVHNDVSGEQHACDALQQMINTLLRRESITQRRIDQEQSYLDDTRSERGYYEQLFTALKAKISRSTFTPHASHPPLPIINEAEVLPLRKPSGSERVNGKKRKLKAS